MREDSALVPIFIKAHFDVDGNRLEGEDMSLSGSFSGRYDTMDIPGIKGKEMSDLIIYSLINERRRQGTIGVILKALAFMSITALSFILLFGDTLKLPSSALYITMGFSAFVVLLLGWRMRKDKGGNGDVSQTIKDWSLSLILNLMLDIGFKRSKNAQNSTDKVGYNGTSDEEFNSICMTNAWLDGDRSTVKIAPFVSESARIMRLKLKSIVPKDGTINFLAIIKMPLSKSRITKDCECTCLPIASDEALEELGNMVNDRNPSSTDELIKTYTDKFDNICSIEDCGDASRGNIADKIR